MQTVHVLCFGNLWHGDDGFGIHVFRGLQQRTLPPSVKVFEVGTCGANALELFEDCQKVLLVDALFSSEHAGRVHRAAFGESALPEAEFSIHAAGVEGLLALLPIVFEGRPLPQIIGICAEVITIQKHTDRLSAPVQAAVEEAIDLVFAECRTIECTS